MDSMAVLIGQRIRSLRSERGMSREELAEAIGLGLEMLRKIETGHSFTSMGTFILIAHAFEVDPLHLLTFPGTNPVHDTIEILRTAPKNTARAIYAAATGLAEEFAKPRGRASGE